MHISGGAGAGVFSISGVSGGGGIRAMSPKQLLTVILVIFSVLSFLKLLFLTSSSSPFAARHRGGGGAASAWDLAAAGDGNGTGDLAPKEAAFLRSIVAARAPCRLLVFGLSPRLADLAAANSGAGASTAFVTDIPADAAAARRVLPSNAAAKIHQVRYRDAAGDAWPLLRRARDSPACRRPPPATAGKLGKSGCHLALTSILPREVLDARWDVVVVDGPSGAGAGEPGRMGAIYTAAALARAAAPTTTVDVAVHDVDRTVERWYAWEYLCEDNLAAAKGRLWHFRLSSAAAGGGGAPADAFCSIVPAQII